MEQDILEKKIAELMSSFDNNNISYFIDDDLNKVGKSINNIKVLFLRFSGNF